jgi:ElaB/YqjD/DUF883 family membrane-anchored ribosome-binding protein
MATPNRDSNKTASERDVTGEEAAAGTHKLRERGREVRAEGEALMEATQGAIEEMSQLVGRQLESRPYATLGTAFGFGLLLGGGLPFGVVRFTARAAAGIFLSHVVEAALPGAPSRA